MSTGAFSQHSLETLKDSIMVENPTRSASTNTLFASDHVPSILVAPLSTTKAATNKEGNRMEPTIQLVARRSGFERK